MVSVLALPPKVRGFKPSWGDGFLRAIKVRSTLYFSGEVKPLTPCKNLWHVKVTLNYEEIFRKPNL
jgi:hypothetical protein